MQVVCKVLSGRTLLLDGIPRGDTSALLTRISGLEGVPADELRLVCAGHDLRSQAGGEGAFDGSTVSVLLRLMGGKGGFGAMLRTAGTRGVKTTNFDACRDLNGRRLRHVNAEAKLREWDMQAAERKLKEQQQQALSSKASGPPAIERFDDEAYEEMLAGTRSRVSEALAAAGSASEGSAAVGSSSSSSHEDADASKAQAPADMGGAAEMSAAPVNNGKRKAVLTPVPQKAPKLWADPLAGLGEDASSSDDNDDGA